MEAVVLLMVSFRGILPAHTVLSSLQAPLAAAGSCLDWALAQAYPRATSQPMILSNTSDSGNAHMWHLTSSSVKASNFSLHRLMIHHLLLLMASYVESGSVKQHWPYIFPDSKSWFQETIPFPNIQQRKRCDKGREKQNCKHHLLRCDLVVLNEGFWMQEEKQVLL